MPANAPARRAAARVTTLALALAAAGCRSGADSRWAWNPLERRGAEASAVASTDPKLPSEGATPLIESAEPAKPPVASVAAATSPTKAMTPPALAGMAPTFQAVAQAVPSIDKPAPTAPGWTPYPSGVAAAPPAMQGAVATSIPAPAKTAVASAGPYNPNGYKPAAPIDSAMASAAGTANRYASAAAAPLADLPPLDAPAKAVAAAGDRYGSSAAASVDRYATGAAGAANRAASNAVSATQGAFGAVTASVDRYAASGAAVAGRAQQSAQQAVQSLAAAPAAALPAYPSPSPTAAASPYPTTSSVAAASPYPVATASSGQRPEAKREPSTVGMVPPSGSYASNRSPVTPIPATASDPLPAAGAPASVVRLTTLPGEYRPGGTGTYKGTATSSTGEVRRY